MEFIYKTECFVQDKESVRRRWGICLPVRKIITLTHLLRKGLDIIPQTEYIPHMSLSLKM